MAIEKISLESFLSLSKSNVIIDVRSPLEFSHAKMPDAINIPLFTDEERKIVGTAYKQQSREIAIKIGLDFFGPKMKSIVEEIEQLVLSKEQLGFTDSLSQQAAPQTKKTILIHCSRGGMRSAAVAWLLDLYGFKVYTLQGGYKAYRNWVLLQFNALYNFKVIGGYTGSGKTEILKIIQQHGENIIDLEALANHKGSAFGALGQKAQPSQEMFENLLASKLSSPNNHHLTNNNEQSSTNNHLPTCIYIEDESQRIGNIQIPMQLWKNMRNSKIYFFDIPFEERLSYLTMEYGMHKKDQLVNAIMRIQKRLGGLETKNAINLLLENNFKESFSILLTYYDKWYLKGLKNRENLETLINTITSNEVNATKNANIILQSMV